MVLGLLATLVATTAGPSLAGTRALPPGIAKKTLPSDLLAQLPARPGQEWRVVGTDLLIVEVTTEIIIDVLKDALRGKSG